MMSLSIAIATCIRTNQNPNSVRRRFAPPHTIWVLCPNKNGDSYSFYQKPRSEGWLEAPPLTSWLLMFSPSARTLKAIWTCANLELIYPRFGGFHRGGNALR
jgi:hypothetical protein